MNTHLLKESSLAREVKLSALLVGVVISLMSALVLFDVTTAHSEKTEPAVVRPIKPTYDPLAKPANIDPDDHPLRKRYLLYTLGGASDVKRVLDRKMMKYYDLDKLSTAIGGGQIVYTVVLQRKKSLM